MTTQREFKNAATTAHKTFNSADYDLAGLHLDLYIKGMGDEAQACHEIRQLLKPVRRKVASLEKGLAAR